jgi:hypothetical protein
MLARGQARIVVAEHARLVDRAWQGTLNALRSFAGKHDDKQGNGKQGNGKHDADQAPTEATS